MRSRLSFRLVGLVCLLATLNVASPAVGDQIYGTGPGCQQFLCFGFDVSTAQAVGVRFVPGSDFSLQDLGFWFMNNDFSGQVFGEVNITVEGDLEVDGCSTPDGVAIDSTSFEITAIGFEPEFNTAVSTQTPFLAAGTPYWIVARSESQAGQNPVWVSADGFTGFTAFTEFSDLDSWQCGGESGTAGLLVGGDRIGGDFDVTVANLVAGQDATVTVTGAEPNTTTYLALSGTGIGETFIASLNVTVELANPFQQAVPVTTDASGSATFTLAVPGDASGRTLWLQAVQFDKRSDLVSEVAE